MSDNRPTTFPEVQGLETRIDDFASSEIWKHDHGKPSLSLTLVLRQDLINYVGEAHRVWSPRVDVHRSLSADGLHERLLRRGDVAVVDRDEFDLNLDIARARVRDK